MKKIMGFLLLTVAFSNIGTAFNFNIRVPRVGWKGSSRGTDSSSGAGTVERTSDAYIIRGAGHDKTITLNGERVEINGASNTLTIKGKVSSIDIRGAGNTIYVDSVEKVSISGASSKVLYKTSPTKSGVPSTTIRGAGSYVQKQ